ncbi:MAG TPA: GTPase Era [Rudaea sp.]
MTNTTNLTPPDYRCGTAAVVGRPNVGKSTLVNALVGQRISIVGPKPQTTRHRILGIVTRTAGQILLIDTPGLHHGGGQAMNRQLNRAARQALSDADVILHLVEAGRWTDEDEAVWKALAETPGKRLLAINKVDAQKDKKQLLPYIAKVNAMHAYDGVYLVSAQRRDGLADLEQAIIARLPVAPPVFGEEDITDRSERFLAGELVREQVMLRLSQELPYAAAVEIESFVESEDGRAQINAVIWVEREGQKGIVIGAGGAQLKAIGSAARLSIEKVLGRRVFLQLWVKVRENWSDNEAALRQFGYEE